jgi:uncharacterized RDD family membrane protein YckC
MVSVSFSCDCGETISLPETWPAPKFFCLGCRRFVPLPDGVRQQLQRVMAAAATGRLHAQTNWVDPAARDSAPGITTLSAPILMADLDHATEGLADFAVDDIKIAPVSEEGTVEIDQPTHFEWVFGTSGKERWKLTCPCGKRLLTPAPSPHPYGTCPKCNRKLPLPGYDQQPKVTRVGARPETSEGTVVARAVRVGRHASGDPKTQTRAAATAANLLRPGHSRGEPGRAPASGRISAWPSAGLARRALATFIDLTLSVTAGGLALLAAQSLPQTADLFPTRVLLLAVFAATLLNDVGAHLLLGGSIGKRLALIVVRTEDGAPCGFFLALRRALAKWLLLPGCLAALFDSTERPLHDMLCKTMVLKGRSRKN